MGVVEKIGVFEKGVVRIEGCVGEGVRKKRGARRGCDHFEKKGVLEKRGVQGSTTREPGSVK